MYIKVKEKSESELKGENRRRLKEVKVTQRQTHPYDRVAVQMNAKRSYLEYIYYHQKTRMKTSISSKALPTDRRTKYLQNKCLFMRGICTKKIGAISQLGAEKITFPPKRG